MKIRGCLYLVTPFAVLMAAQATGPNAPKPLAAQDLAPLLAARPFEGQPLKRFEAFQKVPGAAEFAAGTLGEKGKADQWSNAVFALGAIGDRKAKDTLDAFLRAPNDPLTGTGKLSLTTFNAKVDALFAFGYMALHSPDPHVRYQARLFLDNAAGPSARVWREITWESPYHSTIAARNAYMASKVRRVMRAIADYDGGTKLAMAPKK